MIGHVAENVIVDVAEELDLGLDAPVVFGVRERWVVVEHARVPAAHLVVGFEVGVLDIVFFEDAGGFFKKFSGNPGWSGPVFAWDDMVGALCLRFGLCESLKFFGEGDVVEEGPRVVEFVIPRSF